MYLQFCLHFLAGFCLYCHSIFSSHLISCAPFSYVFFFFKNSPFILSRHMVGYLSRHAIDGDSEPPSPMSSCTRFQRILVESLSHPQWDLRLPTPLGLRKSEILYICYQSTVPKHNFWMWVWTHDDIGLIWKSVFLVAMVIRHLVLLKNLWIRPSSSDISWVQSYNA